jgi:hypothetical protein
LSAAIFSSDAVVEATGCGLRCAGAPLSGLGRPGCLPILRGSRTRVAQTLPELALREPQRRPERPRALTSQPIASPARHSLPCRGRPAGWKWEGGGRARSRVDADAGERPPRGGGRLGGWEAPGAAQLWLRGRPVPAAPRGVGQAAVAGLPSAAAATHAACASLHAQLVDPAGLPQEAAGVCALRASPPPGSWMLEGAARSQASTGARLGRVEQSRGCTISCLPQRRTCYRPTPKPDQAHVRSLSASSRHNVQHHDATRGWRTTCSRRACSRRRCCRRRPACPPPPPPLPPPCCRPAPAPAARSAAAAAPRAACAAAAPP